jgi:hypothetical protein
VAPAARVPGLEVKWDGKSVGEGLWGTAVPVDAVEHSIEAAAPGKKTWTGNVLVRPNASAIAVEIPPLADAPLPKDGPKGPDDHPISLTIQGGPVFTPLFGGDVLGSCTGLCSMALGIGANASLYASYRFTTGFVLGLSGGYLTVKEHATSRPSSLLPVGKPLNLGTVDDSLTLRAGLVGVTGGWQFGTRFPVLLRVGAGGAFGAIRDERSGQFRSSKDVAYAVNPLDTHESMSFVYLAPEARFGLRIGEHVELSVGLEALFLFATAQRVWQPTPWIVGSDGLAKWTTETLSAKTLVFLVPSVALGMSF